MLSTRPTKSTAQPPLSVTRQGCCGWMWTYTKPRFLLLALVVVGVGWGWGWWWWWAGRGSQGAARVLAAGRDAAWHDRLWPTLSPSLHPLLALRVAHAHVGKASGVCCKGGPVVRASCLPAQSQLAHHHSASGGAPGEKQRRREGGPLCARSMCHHAGPPLRLQLLVAGRAAHPALPPPPSAAPHR